MAQIVIPNLKKLNLVIPNSVFDLYTQMKIDDSLSFQAIGNKDLPFNVTVKKQEETSTGIYIEALDGENGVLELHKDEWQCHLQSINSEAFLIPGGAAPETTDIKTEDYKVEEMAIMTISEEPTSQNDTAEDITALLPQVVDEPIEDTIISPVSHINIGDDSAVLHQEDLTNVTVSTSTAFVNLPLFKTENVDDTETATEQLIIREGIVAEISNAEADNYSEEAAEPSENANEDSFHAGEFKIEEVNGEEIKDIESLVEESVHDIDITEIVFGKNKKVSLICGGTTQIIREEEQRSHDKTVQLDARDLASIDTRPDEIETYDDTGLDLDACLNETAPPSEQAESVLYR